MPELKKSATREPLPLPKGLSDEFIPGLSDEAPDLDFPIASQAPEFIPGLADGSCDTRPRFRPMATAVAKPVRFVWLRWLGVLPTMFLVFCLGNVIAAPWGPLIRLFGALLTGALMVYLPCRLIPKYRMWAGGFLMALMPLLLLMSALITHPHPEHPISHWIGLGLGLLLYEGGGAFGLAMIADEAKKNASAS